MINFLEYWALTNIAHVKLSNHLNIFKSQTPGNLLITNDTGKLCLLDFGLCAHVNPKARLAMTKAIVHLLARDFTALVEEDAKELGFFPDDFEDIASLTPILTKVLMGGLLEPGSDLQKRKRKLMEISGELNEIFFRYPFQVPPFFALVTRGLGLLEGTYRKSMKHSTICRVRYRRPTSNSLLPHE